MRTTLLIALLGCIGLGAAAENRTFTYFEDDDFPVLGYLRRISPNGKWAVGGDDTFQSGGYIINTDNPDQLHMVPDGELLDVADSGLAAGIYYETINYAIYEHAGIYRDGAWTQLPEPDAIIGRSAAVAISADERVIAGHGLCRPDPEYPGKYYPIVWTLNEATGQYELTRIYDNLVLDGTFGFFVYDMTPDASKIVGTQSLDLGDLIGLILDVESGEVTRFHTLQNKMWYFEAADGWYDTQFVDGYMDGIEDFFNEIFYGANNDYIYGSLAEVTDLQEDGTGIITNYSAVYDIAKGTFETGEPGRIYTAGLGTKYIFTSDGMIIAAGKEETVQNYFFLDQPVDLVYDVAATGTAVCGSQVVYLPSGDIVETPILVLLDAESTLGVDNVAVDASPACVSVYGNTITVTGAENVRIFTADGAMVSALPSAVVAPGVYIVVADGKSTKVIVK